MLGALVATLMAIAFAIWIWFTSHKEESDQRKNGEKPLPPGSMGLPFIGETFEYITPYKPSTLGTFLHKRISRYGDIFKTHIHGQPTIITASAETNQFVFQNEGRLFKCSYPDAFMNIVGEKSIMATHGPMHKKLRQLSLSLVGFESLKAKMLEEMEAQVLLNLNTWEEGSVIQMKDEAASMTFNMLMRQFISLDSKSPQCKTMMQNYKDFMAGLFAFPIKLPGTTYTKCLKGREKVLKALKHIISERRKEKRIVKQDFLDTILDQADKDEAQFTDQLILDFLFGFLFAGYDTTSIAMTMAVKYLTETPMALRALREEHDSIIFDNTKKGQKNLMWEDYKSMPFTFNVIRETLRLSNIGPFLFRECIQDTEIRGYRIPKGWKVVACTTAVNLEPTIYPEPSSFNPWRWQKKIGNDNQFEAFGGGSRYCVGAELAKLEMAVFLHHMVTKFRWEKAKGSKEEIKHCPIVLFGNGYPINVRKRIQPSFSSSCCY
eukprot:Gb_18384 [translate_table: standard]